MQNGNREDITTELRIQVHGIERPFQEMIFVYVPTG